MLTFTDYLNENDLLLEKLMIFGKSAYPKFNNVVILAGGAGSGKGFQLENLIGIEGMVFDVDALKKLAISSNKFAQKVKAETGQDIAKFDLMIPQNVSKIHEILADVYNLPNKHQTASFASILTAPNDRKPNLIFDVTMKDMKKLESISRNVQELGYEKSNIHIVWIVNDLKVALKQNLDPSRGRVVPEEILVGTHEGAALTMKKILDMGDNIKKYMDGVIYLSFNKVTVDTSMVSRDDKTDNKVFKNKKPSRGSYIKDANYIKVKDQGRSQTPSDKLSISIYNKIKEYTPNINTWK